MVFNKNINFHNKDLSRIFRQMSDCYKFIGPEQRFRALAYETASKTLSNMTEPVDQLAKDFKKLVDLKGVGESIAEKIVEYLNTGKIETFEKLKKGVPFSLLELLDIDGVGPSTLRLLHDKLKIETKEDLIQALNNGKLEKVKGFAGKKIENLKRALKLGTKNRLSLKEAESSGSEILKEIKKLPGIHKCELAGSLRRKKETIGDIDIVITAPEKKWVRIINAITKLPQVIKVLAAGRTKASVIIRKNVQVDVRIVHDHEFGAAMFYFTGNKEHNVKLRTIAKKKGWKINEYGVFDEKNGKRLAGRTEDEIYALFGLPFIPPEQRLGNDELDKAKPQDN